MNRKELFRMLLNQFFMCYTFTMLATIVFANLNSPRILDVSVSYLWKAAVFSVCSVLPGMVYYSKEELTKRQWWMRTLIHTVLIEAVLMPAGYLVGMYRGIGGVIAFFFTILAVDQLVRLFSLLGDKLTADSINRELRARRKDKEE